MHCCGVFHGFDSKPMNRLQNQMYSENRLISRDNMNMSKWICNLLDMHFLGIFHGFDSEQMNKIWNQIYIEDSDFMYQLYKIYF